MSDTPKTTHFGNREVPVTEKQPLVAAVFNSVARKYDLMNDAMSLGLHRLWKRYAVDMSGVRSGDQVLDLAGGTGDLTALFSKRVGDKGQVILSDINPQMLSEARKKLIDKGLVNNIDYVEANAEALPFKENSFDIVLIAFGLRNVTDKEKALREMYRVLKPTGRALVLEFSKPTNKLFEKFYDAYSFHVIPKLGKYLANDESSYQYLVESIRKHPDQQHLAQLMELAGFSEVEYRDLCAGVVALHWGRKCL